MIALTWKAGATFLDEKGPSIAVVAFMTFMSWILFWPSGLNVDMAIGKEPDAVKYEKIRTAYSESAAELMRYDEAMFYRTLSILDTKRYYCLMSDYFGSEHAEAVRPATVLRHEALCDIFSEAAAMVDTYADRLNGSGTFYPNLHEFSLHVGGTKMNIGPFLTQQECLRVVRRLAEQGEQASACQSYGLEQGEPRLAGMPLGQG